MTERDESNHERLREMSGSGMSLSEMAEKIGWSVRHVRRMLGRFGLRARDERLRLTVDQGMDIVVKAAAGESYDSLAEEFGVAHITIGRIARGSWVEKGGFCATFDPYDKSRSHKERV